MGIQEDINEDYGSVLLFAIDKIFDTTIQLQAENHLEFHEYKTSLANNAYANLSNNSNFLKGQKFYE